MGSWGERAGAAAIVVLCATLLACSDESGGSLSDHPDIERVVLAAEAGDADALLARVDYESIGCVQEQLGIGAPPLCAGDEAAGDMVDALPAAQCEGHFLRSEQVRPSLASFVDGTVTFYAAYESASFPPGDVAVVFERFPVQGPQPRGGAIYMTAGQITGIDHGCGADAARFAERFEDELIAPAD